MSSPIGCPGNLYQWGRTITNCIEDECYWSRDFINKIPVYSRKLVKYGFPNMQLQIHATSKTYLKINHANMNKFAKKINASQQYAHVIRHHSLVSHVAFKNGFVQVEFQGKDGLTEKSEFDFAIVCAGPINSFNLISRSGLISKIESAEYLDHPTLWLGEIRTKKLLWIHNRLQNRKIVFGAKPGAIVISPEKDFAITIRVRPDSGRGFSKEPFSLRERIMRVFQTKVLSRLGLFYSKNFSIAISFDFSDAAIRGVLSENGEIADLCYSNFGPRGDSQLLNLVDDVIRENFGAFEKTWGNEASVFEESPAAHYAGFLGLLRNDDNESILDGFRLKSVPQISLPGSVSFPGPVIGHPTYLALLSVLHEVERINAVHFNH